MRCDPDPPAVALPPAPVPAPPVGFPWLAVVAPLVAAALLWAVTRSPFALVFAALGPVLAVGHTVDARRQRRATGRRDDRTATAALDRLRDEIAAGFAAERRRIAALVPTAHAVAAAGAWPASPPVVRLGTATLPSGLRISGDDAGRSPVVERAVAAIRADAAELADCPLVVPVAAGVLVIGPEAVAAPVARAIALDLAAALPPDAWRLAAAEPWTAALPHRRTARTVGYRWECDGRPAVEVAWRAPEDAVSPPPGTSVLRLAVAGSSALVRCADGRELRASPPPAVAAADAALQARALRDVAVRLGLVEPGAGPPERVPLDELLATVAHRAAPPGTLTAPLGRDGRGPVLVDLVAEGPHALIAGTTGAGKSELLVAWVLALAARHPPDRLAMLLVDFKGGAGFAPLAGLPHVVGVVTDLDRAGARRAMRSLRAELGRRELALARAGVASIDDRGGAGLARLVVVIDEYAALVADDPELHDLVADLAARGRSLGLHLVLCTQRPAGVVRDGVLANIGLRVCLRVADRAESVAVLGDDRAAALPARPIGRAVVASPTGGGVMQVAIAAARDAERIARVWPDAVAPAPPWVAPPPAEVPLALVRADGPAWPPVLGLLDVPDRQRLETARWLPERHGGLLVIGGPGSGRTTALDTVAAAGPTCRLPDDPADAWAVLAALLGGSRAPGAAAGDAGPRLLVIDDLDVLLDRLGDERRLGFAAMLARVLRDRSAPAVAVSATRIPVGAAGLVAAFGARLLLGLPSRDEHVLAGGSGPDWRPRRAGAGVWQGAELQVACDAPRLASTPWPVPTVAVPAGAAVVTSRPRAVLDRLRAAGHRVAEVDDAPAVLADAAAVLVGDPDAWQSAWSLLADARRGRPMLVDGCTDAELRAVARIADAPPLGDRPGEAWSVRERVATRVRVDWDAAPDLPLPPPRE